MNKFQVVAALLAFVAAAQQVAAGPAEDLASLCTGSQDLKLTKMSQVVEISELVATKAPADCKEPVLAGLKDLASIVADGVQDGCSIEKVNKMVEFSKAHLTVQSKLPQPLKEFFSALGFEMNLNCKKRFFDGISGEGHKLVREKLNNAMYAYFDRNGFFGSVFHKQSYTKLIDFLAAGSRVNRRQRPRGYGANMDIYSEAGDIVARLQADCTTTFRPVYKPLVDPLVKLATLGFNVNLNKQVDRLSHDSLMKRWLKIIGVCETVVRTTLDDYHRRDSAKSVELQFLDERVAEKHSAQFKEHEKLTFQPKSGSALSDDLFAGPEAKALRGAISELLNQKTGGLICKLQKWCQGDKSIEEIDDKFRESIFTRLNHYINLVVYMENNKARITSWDVFDSEHGVAGSKILQMKTFAPFKLMYDIMTDDDD